MNFISFWVVLRKEGQYFFVLVLIMAVLDVLGVASILPFIAVLSDPSIINRSSILSTIYAYSGSQSEINFLFLLGLMTFYTLYFYDF